MLSSLLTLTCACLVLACAASGSYCSSEPNADVQHSHLALGSGALNRSLGATAHVLCALGFRAAAGALESAIATCSVLRQTSGQWTGLNLTCNGVSLSTRLLCCCHSHCALCSLLNMYTLTLVSAHCQCWETSTRRQKE